MLLSQSNSENAGNMYLSGAKNMAEALRQSQSKEGINNQQNEYQRQHPSQMSIAMRMKQNRDALLGNPVTQPNSKGASAYGMMGGTKDTFSDQ